MENIQNVFKFGVVFKMGFEPLSTSDGNKVGGMWLLGKFCKFLGHCLQKN